MTLNMLLRDWSFEPLVIVPLVLAGCLYWLGGRTPRGAARDWWRADCFYLGLVTIFVALEGPVDWFDGQLFWVHMLQHLMLIMVAAPLLVLGDPVMPFIRSSPLRPRRKVLKVVSRQSALKRAGHLVSSVATPWPVAIVFTLDLYLWHWSWLFNLTLQNQVIHDVEHVCFLVTALVLWSQVIDQKPLRAQMGYLHRAAYIVIVGAAGNLLAMYFVFAQRPLYTQYASLHPRPFGMGALMDQQLAGALMWVPVLFVFATAFAICLYKWLGEQERPERATEMLIPGYRLLDGSLSSDART